MKFFLALLFTLFSVSVHAQQKHFIYIQSDNRQPFYVKQDKKIMSSTPAGYLVIPKLFSGTYDFLIGFPKDEFPEQKFTCVVGETDAGYQLKNMGEKGWALFNFQSMELLLADATYKKDSGNAAVPQDAFAEVLSKVVNDPGIKVVEEKKEEMPDSAKLEKPVQETNIASNKNSRSKSFKKPAKETVRRRPVNKIKENKTIDSLSLTYVDRYQGRRDTINVVFPLNELKDSGSIEMNKTDSAAFTTMPVVKTEQPVADTTQLVVMTQPVDESISTIIKSKKQEEIISIPADTAARQISVSIPPATDSVKTVSLEVPTDESVTTILKDKKQLDLKDSVEITGINKNIPVDTLVKQFPIETVTIPVMSGDSLQAVTKESSLPVSIDSMIVQENKVANVPVIDSTDQWAVKPNIQKDTAMAMVIEKPVMADTLTAIVDTPAITQSANQVLPDNADSVNMIIRDSAESVKPVEIIMEKENKVDSVSAELKTDSVKAIPISQPEIVEKPIVKNDPQPSVVVPKPTRNCTAYADDDEYLNLRKKMEKIRDNENQMLSMANKLFEKRCFNTKQLQRLSMLFHSNEGKYKLFDNAYNHTYDPENFPALVRELTDDYYKRRFQAMLR